MNCSLGSQHTKSSLHASINQRGKTFSNFSMLKLLVGLIQFFKTTLEGVVRKSGVHASAGKQRGFCTHSYCFKSTPKRKKHECKIDGIAALNKNIGRYTMLEFFHLRRSG